MAHSKKKQAATGRLAPNMAELKSDPPGSEHAIEFETTRSLICQAASEIIGEFGYSKATISRIMERAGLATGTFYNYFESRQSLFDILLHLKGKEILQHVDVLAHDAEGLIGLETRAYLSFCEYVERNPWFFRLLHEAHVAAPEGHRRHVNFILCRYRALLSARHAAGEMPGFEANELDTVAFMLMSARDYVCSTRVAVSNREAETIRSITRTYEKFISYGLRGSGEARAGRKKTGTPDAPEPKLAGRRRLRRRRQETGSRKLAH